MGCPNPELGPQAYHLPLISCEPSGAQGNDFPIDMWNMVSVEGDSHDDEAVSPVFKAIIARSGAKGVTDMIKVVRHNISTNVPGFPWDNIKVFTPLWKPEEFERA